MKNLLLNLVRDEEGQGMVEYGLIVALIAVALIVTLQTTKGKIGEVFGRVDSGLDSVGGGGGATPPQNPNPNPNQ